jgi:hippurate hydrolase
MGLQTVVSRNIDPTKPAVVTIGKFTGGTAPNIIPGEVELSISVRSFDEDVRRILKERITKLVHAQADSFDVVAHIDYMEGYPVVTNAEAETDLAIEVARELVGDANVTENMEPLMGSEDFAYMLQACPGTFLRIGNGPHEGGRTLHSATYDFNDENLVVGAAFWARLVERYLQG